MPSFRRMAIVSTVATFLLVAIGGLVRATDSGLGCGDDWPGCNGKLIPVLNARPVVIEWTHRATAMVVGFLIILLVIQAVREHRDRPGLVRLAGVALALVIGQGLLGRVVVKGELEVLLVVAHLATALIFIATLIWLVAGGTRAAGGLAAGSDANISKAAMWAAGALLLLLLVGSYTSDYGYIPGWPLQHGRFIPNLGVEREAVHFLHRVLALAVAVAVAALAVYLGRRAADLPLAARLARVAAVLFAVEILIGALNIWTELNPVVVMLHLATGTAIWSCVVGLIAVTSPALEQLVAPAGRARTSPILESGR